MFWQNLKRLWRHPRFRRILGVRIFTQAADGTLQVGMASYVLLSPEQQPDAWSIAMVLAITLLPFCLLGPFVSLVLDRWSRQRILVGTDGLRCLIALMLGVLVWNGARDKASHIALLILLLVAMSMNRFLLTALTAGLEHTIDKREYLTASSIMPIIGPLGLMLGAVIATAVRMIAGRHMPVHHADTIIFVISATLFAFSVGLGMRFDRWELGPTHVDRSESASDVLRSALEGFRHCAHLPTVRTGLTFIGVQRVLFGVYSVAMILGYRNLLHAQTDINGAMGDMMVWGVVMGTGIVLSAAFMPPLVHGIGMRRALTSLMVATAVVQVFPGAIINRFALLIASFFIGVFAQSVKAGTDTICQAHVADAFKGRVFIVYDMVYNAAFVAGSALAAALIPDQGMSTPHLLSLGGAYLLLGIGFLLRTHQYGDAVFNRGTALGGEPLTTSEALPENR